ncbi:hypothetical protein N7G274_008690 [Stereocaulon virgatum]|uniref:Uncharacterized protein n=1 Tax=Stereocaulon virgatum TaxID=373712 RepID=A0ABR4A2N9_9LECA
MPYPGTLTRSIASFRGYTLPLNLPFEGNPPFDPSTATLPDLRRRLLSNENVTSAFLVEQSNTKNNTNQIPPTKNNNNKPSQHSFLPFPSKTTTHSINQLLSLAPQRNQPPGASSLHPTASPS